MIHHSPTVLASEEKATGNVCNRLFTKPSFGPPWRVGNAAVGSGNAGWIMNVEEWTDIGKERAEEFQCHHTL